jgi:hypothetical protein
VELEYLDKVIMGVMVPGLVLPNMGVVVVVVLDRWGHPRQTDATEEMVFKVV